MVQLSHSGPVKGHAGEFRQAIYLSRGATAELGVRSKTHVLRSVGHLLARLGIGLDELLAKLSDLGVLAMCLRQLPDARRLQADLREISNEMPVAVTTRPIGPKAGARGSEQANHHKATNNFCVHAKTVRSGHRLNNQVYN